MGTEKVKCTIISGAPDSDVEFLKSNIDINSFIICADSGYLNCRTAGILPSLIIGDFDSSEVPDEPCEIITLQPEKDDTDTFYCVKEAVERGYNQIDIYCGIGSRFDHTYSNILCLEYCRKHNIDACIKNSQNKIFLTDSSITLYNNEYKYFSLFALFGTVFGLNIKGAYYELNNTDLHPYDQFTQSNTYKYNAPVEISLKKGILLIIQSND